MARKEKQAALGLLVGILGGLSKRKAEGRKGESDIKAIFANALAQQQAKEAFPSTEEQALRKVLSLSGQLKPTPTPGGSGFTAQERGLGLPAQVEESSRQRNAPVQSRIDTLLTVAGKKPKQSFAEQLVAAEALSQAKTRGTEAGTAPRRQKEDANELRKEFINRPETKDFVAIRDKVKLMDDLLAGFKAGNQKNLIALDQALISTFNKITDPTSVVRESEFERTPQNIPLFNRFPGALQKLKTGGAGLITEDREALVFGAKLIADSRGQTFNAARKATSDLAGRLGLDSELVIGTLDLHTPFFNFDQQAGDGSQQVGRFKVRQVGK